MCEFLVETYAPENTTDTLALRVEQVTLAAEQVSEPEAEVRLLSAILLPKDDICFYLFRSSSAQAVREAMTLAGLQFDRITQAVSNLTHPDMKNIEGLL